MIGLNTKRQIAAFVVACCAFSLLALTAWKAQRNGTDKQYASMDKQHQSRRLQASEVGLIWAISYPQTGITGLVGALHISTGKSMATNYGDAYYNRNNNLESRTATSVPVNPNRLNGPFASAPHLPLPDKYTLVRTHCAGFCLECSSPRDYVLFLSRIDLFISECSKSTRFTLPNTSEAVRYDSGTVKKILWLIRDPFDTVVARFKQLRFAMEHKGRNDFLQKYPDTVQGFKDWCSDLDYAPHNLAQESLWYENKDFAYGVRVPCRAEFYKVVKFHNQVYLAAQNLKLPLKVVRYEDFKNSMTDEMREVHSFLEVDFNPNKVEEFVLEDSYGFEYYDHRGKVYGAQFMEAVMEPGAYKEMKGYTI